GCSFVKASASGFPAAFIRSKRCPMRTSIAFGKREWIKTLSDIDASCWIAKQRAGRVAPFRPGSSESGSQPGLTEQAARLNLHAPSHPGGNRHALDVGALRARRLRLGDRIRQRLDVLHQLFFRERRLADAGLHDAGLLDPELDRPALGA